MKQRVIVLKEPPGLFFSFRCFFYPLSSCQLHLFCGRFKDAGNTRRGNERPGNDTGSPGSRGRVAGNRLPLHIPSYFLSSLPKAALLTPTPELLTKPPATDRPTPASSPHQNPQPAPPTLYVCVFVFVRCNCCLPARPLPQTSTSPAPAWRRCASTAPCAW